MRLTTAKTRQHQRYRSCHHDHEYLLLCHRNVAVGLGLEMQRSEMRLTMLEKLELKRQAAFTYLRPTVTALQK